MFWASVNSVSDQASVGYMMSPTPRVRPEKQHKPPGPAAVRSQPADQNLPMGKIRGNCLIWNGLFQPMVVYLNAQPKRMSAPGLRALGAACRGGRWAPFSAQRVPAAGVPALTQINEMPPSA